MIKKIIAGLTIFFYTTTYVIAAPTCQKTGSVCTDTTPSKTISGVPVSLAQAGGCWQYTDTYNCLKPNAVNYCAAISQIPGCSQTNSVCAVTDTTFGTGCMQWANTYQCGAGITTPANTTVLNTTYTIAPSVLNTAQCASFSSNPTCSLASQACTDTTPSKVISGATVTLAQAGGCWNYVSSYSCVGAMQSNCAPLVAKGCTLQTTTPVQQGQGGVVTLTENVYSCPVTAASTSTALNCGSQQYCTSGNCFNTGHVSNSDIAQAAAAMELVREGAVYKQGFQIFGGEVDKCTDRLGGLGNCCTSNAGGAAMSNNLVMGAVIQVGGQAVAYGSKYMFDALMNSPLSTYVQEGFASMMGGEATCTAALSAGTFSPGVGAFGFTVGYGTPAAGSTLVGAGSSSAASTSGFYVDFNPAMFYIAVAVLVYSAVTSCTQKEHMLSMLRGQQLCRYATSYCSKSTPLGCYENTQQYCCFNSLLAQIINTAGGKQLGRAVADCSGFTTAQFGLIDFSKIDLSQFLAQVKAAIKMPNMTAIGNDTKANIAQKFNNFKATGHQ